MVSELTNPTPDPRPIEESRATSHPGLSREMVAGTLETLTRRLDELNRRLLIDCPLDRYIGHLDDYPEIACYSYIGPEVKEMVRTLRERGGARGLERYHQSLLLTLLLRSTPA